METTCNVKFSISYIKKSFKKGTINFIAHFIKSDISSISTYNHLKVINVLLFFFLYYTLEIGCDIGLNHFKTQTACYS